MNFFVKKGTVVVDYFIFNIKKSINLDYNAINDKFIVLIIVEDGNMLLDGELHDYDIVFPIHMDFWVHILVDMILYLKDVKIWYNE
jgi:hypothetical protein